MLNKRNVFDVTVVADRFKNFGFVVILTVMLIFLVLLASFNLSDHGDQQFSELARSFLQGKLYFTQLPADAGLHDVAFFNCKYFWPLGPLPAFLLMPLVAIFDQFNLFFYQGYIEFFITLSIFYLIFRISRIFKYATTDSLYLALAFGAGSSYLHIALIPKSYFYAQSLTVLLLLLAIHEFLTKKRYWLIGLYLGSVLMTRITAVSGAIFFILMSLTSNKKFTDKIRELLEIVAPLTASFIILLIYNYSRFHNWWESGYNLQLVMKQFIVARSYGLFSLAHLPGNLYYFLLGHPLPIFRDEVSHVLKPPYIVADPWGMSIFITSPYYLYLFWGSYRDRLAKILWITVIATAVPIFMYYGIGWIQFGYRYALDFLPFLFLLFLIAIKQQTDKLSLKLKILIVVGAFFNIYLISSLINYTVK